MNSSESVDFSSRVTISDRGTLIMKDLQVCQHCCCCCCCVVFFYRCCYCLFCCCSPRRRRRQCFVDVIVVVLLLLLYLLLILLLSSFILFCNLRLTMRVRCVVLPRIHRPSIVEKNRWNPTITIWSSLLFPKSTTTYPYLFICKVRSLERYRSKFRVRVGGGRLLRNQRMHV